MLPETRDSVGVSGEQKEGIVKKSDIIKGTIDYSTDNMQKEGTGKQLEYIGSVSQGNFCEVKREAIYFISDKPELPLTDNATPQCLLLRDPWSASLFLYLQEYQNDPEASQHIPSNSGWNISAGSTPLYLHLHPTQLIIQKSAFN